MDRAYLGESGIAVSRVILGCGNFGGVGSAPAFFGKGETKEEAFAVMDAAWEAGITTFDTADAYGGGRSESYIGEWLRTKGPDVRDAIVLSTKTFNPMEEGGDRGLAPARIRRQLESSLERLGVEHVPMYLTHAWDAEVPVAETLGALAELQQDGKIGAYGASNVDGAQLREALAAGGASQIRDNRGRRHGPSTALQVGAPGGYEWVQNSYSLLDREADQEVLPLCAEHGLGFTPFGPLAGGWLTGKYRRDEPVPEGSRMTLRPEPYEHLRDDRVYDALEGLAELGPPAQLALAWLFADPRITAVVVGPRHAGHLEPALAALASPLDAGLRDEVTHLFEE